MRPVPAAKGCTVCDGCASFSPGSDNERVCGKPRCGHREAEHAPCSRKQYQFPIEQFNHRCGECGLYPSSHVEAEHAPCSRKQYKFPPDQLDRRCGECGLYPSAHVEAEDAPCALTLEQFGPIPQLPAGFRCSSCGLDVGRHTHSGHVRDGERSAQRRRLVLESLPVPKIVSLRDRVLAKFPVSAGFAISEHCRFRLLDECGVPLSGFDGTVIRTVDSLDVVIPPYGAVIAELIGEDAGVVSEKVYVRSPSEDNIAFYIKYIQRPTQSSIGCFRGSGTGSVSCLLCENTSEHGCHIAGVKYFSPGASCHRPEFFQFMKEWVRNPSGRWRRSFRLHGPMNLIPLCCRHHDEFDSHDYLLVYNFLISKFQFLPRSGRGDPVVLPDDHQADGRFELSHRAVAFRLDRIRECGINVPISADQIDTLRDKSIEPSIIGDDDVES